MLSPAHLLQHLQLASITPTHFDQSRYALPASSQPCPDMQGVRLTSLSRLQDPIESCSPSRASAVERHQCEVDRLLAAKVSLWAVSNAPEECARLNLLADWGRTLAMWFYTAQSSSLSFGELQDPWVPSIHDAASFVSACRLHRCGFRNRSESRKGTEHQSLAASRASKTTRYVTCLLRKGGNSLLAIRSNLHMSRLPVPTRLSLLHHSAMRATPYPPLPRNDLTSQQCTDKTAQDKWRCAGTAATIQISTSAAY